MVAVPIFVRGVACYKCYVCGTTGSLLYRGLTDRICGVSGKWDLRKCQNEKCGCIWMDPMPLESELHKAYESYYTHNVHNSGSGGFVKTKLTDRIFDVLKQIWLATLFLRSEKKRLEIMYLDKFPPGRMLEVGCGNGERLRMIRDLGWEVEGQDIDPKAVQNARETYGVKVHLGDLRCLRLPPAAYDAVTMNHVIEHVFKPIALLKECYRILKPGGVLVVATPNPDSYGHAIFKTAWTGLDVPRHLHLFPAVALCRIAAEAGFTEHRFWTTHARADVVYTASLNIRYTGRCVMEKTGKIDRFTFFALAHQLLARIFYIWKKDSGEESILLGVKR